MQTKVIFLFKLIRFSCTVVLFRFLYGLLILNIYLMELFSSGCSRFEIVLQYFKYATKKGSELNPKDFFSIWSIFASDFKDIWNREQQRIFKEKLVVSVTFSLTSSDQASVLFVEQIRPS